MRVSTQASQSGPCPAGDRPAPWSGLASKLILFVFASTFITATIVSWISIQSASSSLRSIIDRLYPLSLDHAAQRIEPWVCEVRLHLEYAARQRTPGAALAPRSDLLDGLAVYAPDGSREAAWGAAPSQARAALRAVERVAVVQMATGGWALAVAPLVPSEGSEMVAIVSLARLVPLFEVELPNENTLLALVDSEGRVLVRAGQSPGDALFDQIDVKPLYSRGSLRETELSGEHVIAAAQRVSLLDWNVAIVSPFEKAFEPVFAVVTRVFVIDLCIILAFSFLAYQVTAAIVQPIEALSEGARAHLAGRLRGGARRDADARRDRPADARLQRDDPQAPRPPRGDRGREREAPGAERGAPARERGARAALDHGRPHASCTTTASSRTT